MDISIIVPCFNEEKNVNGVYHNILNSLSGATGSYEIIFVNDGSTDGTLKELDKLSKLDRNIRIISFTKNRGYGFAVWQGLTSASGIYVFYIDGDGEFDFREHKEMLRFLEEGFDLVGGVRREGRSDGKFRANLAALGCSIFKLLFNIKNIRDINCGFKGIKKSALAKINPQSTSAITFSSELYLSAGKNNFKITQVSVKHSKRKFGNSKGVNFKQYLLALNDITNNLAGWVSFMRKKYT